MHTVHIVCKSTYFLTTRQTFRLKITRISKIYPPKQKKSKKNLHISEILRTFASAFET